MAEERYGVRQDANGTWTIIDTMTRLPAASDGKDLSGMNQKDACDIADSLNRDDRAGRASLLV